MWPLAGKPPAEAECDNCGGKLGGALMAKLKTYYGSTTHHIEGMRFRGRQVDMMVAATSQRAAHQAIVDAGITGWSFYSFRLYWTEGGDEPEAIAEPGIPFYRPELIHGARWVRWGEPYLLDDIPDHFLEAKD